MSKHPMPQSIKPKLLFVSHTSKLGGAERILLSILREFDDRSALWLFEDGPLRAASAIQACSVIQFISQQQSSFSHVKRDKALLRGVLTSLRGLGRVVIEIAKAARRYDIVYANSQKAFVLAALAAKLARRPLVWHLHDILDAAHFGKGQLRLLRLLAPSATRVIVPSEAAATAALALGLDSARVRIVPNGITLPPDGSERVSRADLRERLGLPVSGMLFGVFSRLSPWKGQDIALRALALQPDLTCILAGAALFGETAYEASLRQLASELAIENRVYFLGNRDDVPALMRAVDVVVHPSRDPEPFGRTLVEAMLCGTPVIATDVGAAREILAEGKAGMLIEPGNPEAIVRALNLITNQTDDSRRRVATAEQRAVTDYTEQVMRDRVLTILQEVFLQHRAIVITQDTYRRGQSETMGAS